MEQTEREASNEHTSGGVSARTGRRHASSYS